jgi:hypothetical protein
MAKLSPAGNRTRNGSRKSDMKSSYQVGAKGAGGPRPLNKSAFERSPLQGGVNIGKKRMPC